MSPCRFQAPQRMLLGPGPSCVSSRVLQAMAQPTVGHMDPFFLSMMEEIKQLLQYAFQTRNELTFPISGPGSAGMEACFVNLVEPGEKIVICRNGVFGGRMQENAIRLGAQPILVDDDWGQPVDPHKLEHALRLHPDVQLVAFVHAETSTGAQSDAAALASIAHKHDCLVIVDAVTSLGGTPVRVDEWDVDAIYSGSQKCLSCPPGLSPVSFNARAVQRIKRRKHRVQSWFLDMGLVMNYWNSGEHQRVYHHTAPVNSLYALHESLVILKEEGLEASWTRHRRVSEELRLGLEALGLCYLVDEPYRLPQLSSVHVPPGVDEAQVRNQLLHDFGIEIGGGLGDLSGKIWRFGLMGHGCRSENVERILGALRELI
jgi:alanine-glyoxylate transaminase / serine-glyoxylate transaminase / serine-pyruvate transaminase